MKLIASHSSPFARKVRIVMLEKKLDYQMVSEDVWAKDSTIQQINPLGKVPALVMEDGGAVFDSRVIVEYLDTLTPVGKLIPANGKPRLEVKCWEALADGLMDAAVAIRIEQTQRPTEKQSAEWIARQTGKVHAALASIAHGLADKPFCSGISFTLADIAVGCALSYLDFRFPHIDWRSSHTDLAKYAEKIFQRQSFIDTQPPG